MRRSFAVSLSSFLGPYGILPLTLRRRRLQMFHLPFSLSLPHCSLSFSLFLSLILLLCLSPTGFGWSRFSSVLLTVRIPPPAIGNVCNVRACSPLLSPPSPSPFLPPSCCSVYKWIHHPCVSCGTFLNRTHSDPL